MAYIDHKKEKVTGKINAPIDVLHHYKLSPEQVLEMKTAKDALDESYKQAILSVRLGEKMKAELTTIARLQEMSGSDLVYELIRSYVYQNRGNIEGEPASNDLSLEQEIKLFRE